MKGVVNLDEYKKDLKRPRESAILKTQGIVKKFKSKTEITIQNNKSIKRQIEEKSENYVFLAKHCFKEGIKSMTDYYIGKFAVAFSFIGTPLGKIKYKSFLIFLNNPNEPVNILNLKKYLKILRDLGKIYCLYEHN